MLVIDPGGQRLPQGRRAKGEHTFFDSLKPFFG